MNSVRELISLHEGRVAHVYQDSLGYWTVGVGHLVDQRKGGKLPEHIIDALLDHDIHEHANELLAILPWVRDLDPVRQAVLVDMHFNLGHGLLNWKITLGHFKAGRWDPAAEEMLRSEPWATQVGDRAVRLAQMTRSGVWPNE